MSGGGGTSWNWNQPEQTDCSKLVERTLLNSPVPAVVANLKIEDVLQVTLSNIGGAVILQAVTEDGEVAGSLTPPRLPQIVECVGRGFSYVAIVQEVDGGAIKVEIRPEAK